MTVRELITKLNQFPGDLPVFMDVYCEDCEDYLEEDVKEVTDTIFSVKLTP